MKPGIDTLKTKETLHVNGQDYTYFSLPKAETSLGPIARLPFSMKVLLENLLRFEDGTSVTVDDVQAMADWLKDGKNTQEIAYRPARVLLQDFTGVPAVVDLAAMRDALQALGGDPKKINPLVPVDLVIDHSVMVDTYGNDNAFVDNVEAEFARNQERYEFLRWGASAFENFRVVPPGTGICHQVNLEYLAKAVWSQEVSGISYAYPDTLVGTDSHTTMVNGLAVLGWGVGGIEAEAAMLGQPISMLIPEVVGFKLTGALKEGVTATDLVLVVVQMLREKGVVGKFVEFYGPGLSNLSLADRATIANMAPEYGATCGFFPIDAEAVRYLEFTGRKEEAKLAEAYARAQGMWREDETPDPIFTSTLTLNMDTVVPSISGPKRPQDRVLLSHASTNFADHLAADLKGKPHTQGNHSPVKGTDYALTHGDVVIAAITSCTNTSNPSVMLAAGLVAKKAHELGVTVKPWVKTSLAPGSQVVTEYLEKAGLQEHLDTLGFQLVGYGCTTCIGNSGPLAPDIHQAIVEGDIRPAAVLSGNRNFEGRVHPLSRFNYLASPPLVVAYAIAGSMEVDLVKDPLATGADGQEIYLKDLWPSNAEITAAMEQFVTRSQFEERYADVFTGTKDWQEIKTSGGLTYDWHDGSTYVQNPPYFENMSPEPGTASDIHGASALAILGDSITTDHISPAGAIKRDGPAGLYLMERQIRPHDFNSFGARRGNHEVMMRGTFANIRVKNLMLGGTVEGGYTKHVPSGEKMDIYEAAMKYKAASTPLVVIGGKEYGTGSSRDWAAKGTILLGVKAVIAESFERIHRSNLVGMGVLPLQFKDGANAQSLGLSGDETYDITGLEAGLYAGMDLTLTITSPGGSQKDVPVLCRIDTDNEVEYYNHGGILPYVLRDLAT